MTTEPWTPIPVAAWAPHPFVAADGDDDACSRCGHPRTAHHDEGGEA